MSRHLWKLITLAGCAALVFAAVACGDDDDDDDGATTPAATRAAGTTPAAGATTAATSDDAATGEEADVEAAMQAVFDAWNAKDVEGLIAGFTDAGLVSTFGDEGQAAAEVQAGLPEFIGSDPISEVTFGDTRVDGESATSEVQFAVGGAFDAETLTLVNEGGDWKIDNEEDLLVEVPAGTATVNVDLNEFAFAFDPAEITGGNVAFAANNVGTQEHELALARIPAGAVVDDIIAEFAAGGGGPGAPLPEGVEFLGAVQPVPPDETLNLVFTDPLTAGRYLMICLFPDTTEGPEGTPHALKGMVRDFTIE